MFSQEMIWGKKKVDKGSETAVRAIQGSVTPSQMTVETIDNHIYFYADIDSDRGLALMRTLRELDHRLRAEQLSRYLGDAPVTPIWLHLYSFGGDLFTGFSLADQLMMIKSPVYAVIEGICASAATLLALSCTRRYILPSSVMLVHQLSSFAYGTHEQFKDEMLLQKLLMEKLVSFYGERTRLTGDEIQKMLTRDFWMDAETCVKLGFADEILR